MTSQDPKSLAWPLIFTYRGTILGQAFVADVSVKGRVIANPESAGVWVYGVNPGAIAVSAPTLDATNTELRDSLNRLFIDFAQEAGSFEKFKAAVEKFVQESDPDSQKEWEAARAEIKAGRVPVPSDLPKETGEAPYSVQVTQKQIAAVTA